MLKISVNFITKKLKNTKLYIYYKILDLRIRKNVYNRKEKKMIDFYSKLLSEDSLVFDVGANIGNRIKVFSKITPNVIAFEPQEDCYKIIKHVYGNVAKIEKFALDNKVGSAEIFLSDINTLSSMSSKWINSVKESGRFSKREWSKKEKIHTTTLDEMIKKYNRPKFIKIDVEGYEFNVLQGLSVPVDLISFEFTPEQITSSLACLNYLDNLGYQYYNISLGESMKFYLDEWTDSVKLISVLKSFNDNRTFGDIYCKLGD